MHLVRRIVKAALGEQVLYFVQAYAPHVPHSRCLTRPSQTHFFNRLVSSLRAAFLKLWSADHKWSSGSVLVVLLD